MPVITSYGASASASGNDDWQTLHSMSLGLFRGERSHIRSGGSICSDGPLDPADPDSSSVHVILNRGLERYPDRVAEFTPNIEPHGEAAQVT